MTQKILPVERDRRPLEEKVKKGFINVERDITSAQFIIEVPPNGSHRDEAVLVNFGDYVFSERVISTFEHMNLRAGLPTELVDVSVSNPHSKDLASSLPLVALGDSWEGPLGNLLVVFLVGDARDRGLGLHWRGGGWNEDYWFLAFRTTSASL